MKQKIIRYGLVLWGVLLIWILLNFPVHAATNYSDVFKDLSKDESFDIRDYPTLTYDELGNTGLLNVIQIAETDEKELCIYVYQPTSETLEIKANSVSISSEFSSNGQNLNPLIYDLELVSSYDVFYKYLVKDYKVSSEAYRYYNIVSIYRPFNNLIDNGIDSGVVNSVALSVGQQWCCYYLNDNLIYEMNTFNTLDVDINYCNYLEFTNGITLGNLLGNSKYGRCHFIAFNVNDYIVQKIYDAKLNYQIRKHTETWAPFVGTEHIYGEYENDYITLNSSDKGTFEGEGLGARNYTWNRILSANDFISDMENQGFIMSSYENEILKNQWVFAFLETETTTLTYDGGYTNIYYDVDNVKILQLHFLDINNKIYDLGVVASGVGGGNGITNEGSNLDLSLITEPLEKVLMLIGIILLLVVCVFLYKTFDFIKNFIKGIVNTIIYIVKLPFKIIKSIFRKK